MMSMTQALVSDKVIHPDAVPALSLAASQFYRKLTIADEYRLTGRLDKATSVTLVRGGSDESDTWNKTFGEDYGVGAVSNGRVAVHIVPGGHDTFLASDKSMEIVLRLISSSLMSTVTKDDY